TVRARSRRMRDAPATVTSATVVDKVTGDLSELDTASTSPPTMVGGSLQRIAEPLRSSSFAPPGMLILALPLWTAIRSPRAIEADDPTGLPLSRTSPVAWMDAPDEGVLCPHALSASPQAAA